MTMDTLPRPISWYCSNLTKNVRAGTTYIFSINPCVLENPSLQYAFTLKVIFEGIGLGQFFRSFQKQSPGGVLWKSCSEKYAKLTGNYLLWILCLGSYIPGLATLIKSTLKQVLSCGFRKNYEKSYPAERLYSTYSKIL